MLRSMSSAISGMDAFQQQLDVIGNNIANVNTTGYKTASTEFSDMLSQTVSGGSKASVSPTTGLVSLGGTNPIQVGLGVKVASIDVNFGQGPDENTGVATNLAINGDGLFSVSKDGGTTIQYTREGDFRLDANNNLVLPDGSVALGVMTKGTPPASVSSTMLRPVNLNSFLQNYYGSTTPALSSSPNLTIGQDGSLNVTDSAGNRVIVGYLGMATMPNPSGMTRSGDSLFNASANSGSPTYLTAGTNGAGTLQSGALEGSNVDLTQEFANMIVAQNGFSANSHMIGTDNTILQAITNLKNG